MKARPPAGLTQGPSLTCKYFDEPALSFANGGENIDPKLGIARFGPKSLDIPERHPSKFRVGFIGTADSVDKAREWIEINSRGVSGDDAHPSFPGCEKDRGFHTQLEFSAGWVEQLNRGELDSIRGTRNKISKFETTLELLDEKMKLLSRKDLAPEYVVIALPDELRNACGVVNYAKGAADIHRDLRRALKALAMKYRLVTQLVDPATIEFRDPDNPTKIAWNFFTGLYFKAGGMPWGPIGLAPASCYVGISFYRGLNASDPKIHTSLVQAFDEYGEGLVLRGPDFLWDVEKHQTHTPHLRAEDTFKLIGMVLDRYQEEMKQQPQRVVIHKSSRWWDEEAAGCREALKGRVGRYDLVALQKQDDVRLLPASKYPALRGTKFTVGEIDYLYTTGFIAELGQFHGVHVPAPVQIADHIGYDTPRETILKEILILTKMNWNSSRLGGLMPITLKFSRLVGEIMREIPSDREPLPQSKYYM
jgi:hypothetical protein